MWLLVGADAADSVPRSSACLAAPQARCFVLGLADAAAGQRGGKAYADPEAHIASIVNLSMRDGLTRPLNHTGC